ncbi:hypothetical protein H1R20_g7717, partial [Candolleomyces eurysporus]
MAYQQQQMINGMQPQQPQQQQQQQQHDVVSGEQYRYALANFRIAHEKVEQQRQQLEEQEKVVAQLKGRISLLEGSSGSMIRGHNGNSIDDFSIKNAASQLDKLINRWASDIVRAPPAPATAICAAILNDLVPGLEVDEVDVSPMQLQCYLRHALSESISEGIINCLIVTNSMEANVQLTRVHEHLFARDPTVACVWRRQTFSAAVESCTPDMSLSILYEQLPGLMKVLAGKLPTAGGVSILDSAYAFSRMLHGAAASSASTADAFYRAFVPELGSALYPRQIELVKRCLKSERGEIDKVGATIFPGLVKISKAPPAPNGEVGEKNHIVVRRAQVICECAMGGSSVPAAYTGQAESIDEGNSMYTSNGV